jgi:hypothetical protein
VADLFGCDLVTHRLDRDGYAFEGKSRAHIVAWEKENGPRPLDADGKPMPIDHLCRRRNCRAVHHLEAVTKSENEKRKIWSYRMRRKRCPKGHDLNVTRAITPEDGVVCRECNKEHRGDQ